MMMKQLKTLLIAAILFVGASHTANAQAKIAHIDVSELMSKYPAMLNADKQLETVGKTYDTQYKGLVDEYQAKLKKYEAESATVGDKVNEERTVEVQALQKRIVDYRDNAQKELQQKEMDLKKPIVEKVRLAIQKVAKAKGYQYVLDASTGGGLLLADGPNLLDDVKKELGF